MDHFIVRPIYGLCNRFRVIASAMRVAEFYRARLTLVHTECDLRSWIQLPDEIEVVSTLPDLSGFARYSDSDRKRPFDFEKESKVFYRGGGAFEEIHLPPSPTG